MAMTYAATTRWAQGLLLALACGLAQGRQDDEFQQKNTANLNTYPELDQLVSRASALGAATMSIARAAPPSVSSAIVPRPWRSRAPGFAAAGSFCANARTRRPERQAI